MLESTKLQETLLGVLPFWNYQIEKPFKRLLDEGVSLEMYYCLQILRWENKPMTMSDLASKTKMTKQQMTKIVNGLAKQEYVLRDDDPEDRRIIKIRITEKALCYIDRFLESEASFNPFLNQLSAEDRRKMQKALDLLFEVFTKIPCDFGIPG